MLSVITYNIHFGQKLSQITQWLHKHQKQFDILCFQEFPEEQIKPFLKTFSQTFAHIYAPGFRIRRGTFGELTLICKDSVSLISSQIVDLGERSFYENTLWRTIGSRTALVTVLQYKKKKIVIANTHLICFTSNKKRRNQITRLLKVLNPLVRNDTSPIVILGDFNYTSLIRQKVLFEFMEKEQFENAFEKPTHEHLFVRQQLDYVFYKNCAVKDIEIEKLHFSDHYPVKLTMEV